jgi:hypothetical protein
MTSPVSALVLPKDGLTTMLFNTLRIAGIHMVEQVEAMGDNELLRLPNLGSVSLRRLRNAVHVLRERSARLPADLSLLGCCFAVWNKDGDRIEYQGIIRGRPDPAYLLVQFFGWFDGDPTELTLIPIERFLWGKWRQPGGILIFENDEHLRFFIEHKQPRERSTTKVQNTEQNSQNTPPAADAGKV